MTNNPTIDGVSRELLRKQFEEKNEHRGWFVAGGRSDDTGPEGFVYKDFTTDMCWTCYFEATVALQSRIDQLEAEAIYAAAGYQAARDRIKELESGRGEPVAWIKPDVAKTLRKDECCYAFGEQNPKGTLIPLYTAPPAPVVRKLEMAQVVRAHLEIPGCPVLTSNQCHALAVKLNACLDATAALNGGKS